MVKTVLGCPVWLKQCRDVQCGQYSVEMSSVVNTVLRCPVWLIQCRDVQCG